MRSGSGGSQGDALAVAFGRTAALKYAAPRSASQGADPACRSVRGCTCSRRRANGTIRSSSSSDALRLVERFAVEDRTNGARHARPTPAAVDAVVTCRPTCRKGNSMDSPTNVWRRSDITARHRFPQRSVQRELGQVADLDAARGCTAARCPARGCRRPPPRAVLDELLGRPPSDVAGASRVKDPQASPSGGRLPSIIRRHRPTSTAGSVRARIANRPK